MNKKLYFLPQLWIVMILLVSHTVLSQPTVTFTNQRDACDGLNNGSIDITATTGVAPVSLFLFGPVTTIVGQPLTVGTPFSVSNLEPGAFTVVVTDGSGMGNFVGGFVIANVAPDLNLALTPGFPVDNSDCFVPNGEIQIDVTGGTGSYSFSWTGPNSFTSSSEDISGLVGGTYTVVVSDDGTNCTRTDNYVITDPLPNVQNITTADPQLVCSSDDVTIDLDGSEVLTDYEILVNGTPSGFITTGTGAPISITITSGNFADGDVLTVEATIGICATVAMNGSVMVNFNDPAIQNITTADPQLVCSADDVTIDLDGSEAATTYEILVNGAPSGFTTAGTGAAISITITSGNFADGDVLTVEADNGQCQVLMNGSVTVNFNDPVVQNITTADPAIVCSTDNITLDLDGSEGGVTYEILVNGVPSGFSAVGTGAAIGVTIIAGNFADLDVLTIEADNGQCQVLMNGSVTVNIDDPAVQNITTADPLLICSSDNATIDLDGSEVGVTYEILVNGAPSGFTAAGTGAALGVTITSGNFADGDVLTIQGTSGTASCVVLMNGSVTVNFNDPALQNVTTADPQIICSVDDITLDLDGSEAATTYEILVNGAPSGFTTAGTGAAISITITAGNFADGDVLTVEADNGICQLVMNGSVTVDIEDPVAQNITTADPLVICSTDDSTVDLDGSEVGVTYEILVNGAPSGFTAAGTGAALSLTITSGSFADGDILTVQGTSGTASCVTLMNGSVTINFDDPAVQNITTADPQVVCSTDDITLDLDGSEVGVTYEILVNGAPSGFTAAGTGAALSLTITAGNFADLDVLTIQATSGTASCVVLMNGTVTVNLNDPVVQNITTADPLLICSVDDVTLDLDGSEAATTYEILVNGAPSGFTTAGTGAAISITITSGNFADGDVLTVEADNGQCQVLMNGSVTVNFDDPAVQNITTADPQVVCSSDDITLDLDGSEVGINYEILVNGAPSGFTAVGTGAALSITITAGNFADTDVLTIQATSGGAACTVLMNGSVTVNFNDPVAQNITTADPQIVCSVDDVTLDLDGSEVGVTYEILVNGAPSGFTAAGTGAALSVTITAGNFASGDVLTIEGDNGQCQTLMTGSVTVTIEDPAVQNITTADPLVICSTDDATVDLDGSEVGVTYEILVNGAPSGFTAAGTGAVLSLTITSGSFADGDILTVQGTSGTASCITLMNGSTTINFDDPAVQNITTADPQTVCSTDDITLDLDGSEAGVTYEILVNGVPSGVTQAGTGAAISLTITAGNFADTDVLTIQSTSATASCVVLMNGSVTVDFDDPAVQNITTADPLVICSTDDATIDLDGSELGVVYEVLINGAPSGVILGGTGAPISFTVLNGTFADGDVFTVEAESGTAFCTVLMNGTVTVTFDDPAVQNITTADPLVICSTDDATVDLDGSEVGVTYEILVNGAPSGFTAAGTGAALSLTITTGSFAAGDILTVQGTSGTASCITLMNGSTTINFDDPAVQNITTADPQTICSTDDITLDLDGSEAGVTYEILVNGAPSGATQAGTGAALSITITAGNFADTDVLTIQATSATASCNVVMNGSVTVDFEDPIAQNITTADPLAVCIVDDAIIDLDGSELGVSYEIFINGAPSGITLAGTGAALTFTVPNGSYADLDVITIVGTSGGLGCTTVMNNSVTISVNPSPVIQNITTPTPLNICANDDLVVDLGSSEGGVNYEIFVNGAPSGFSTAGTGLPLSITLPAGNFADADVITVIATNLAGCTSLMNNNVLVSLNPEPAVQNITTADPQTVCSTDDVIIDLDNSEAAVNYEILLNGAGTGIIVGGTGAAISLTLPGGTYAGGDVVTVEGTNGLCTVPMNGSVTINITNPTVFNITTASPVFVCNAGDVLIDLDGSEGGVNYEVLLNGTPTGNIIAGTGAPIQFTILNGSFADGDVVTIEADNAGCPSTMNGSVTINIASNPIVQNITTADPTSVCDGEDLTIDLDGSEIGASYEILVNGTPSGFSTAGSGAAISIVLPTGNFVAGDVVTVEGSVGPGCVTLMNGSVNVNINPTPALQNITTTDPQDVCSGDDLIIDLDGSEFAVNYEIFINGAPTGNILAGTFAPLSFTLTSGTFADGDIITIEASNAFCNVLMNGSVTVNLSIIGPTAPNALAASNEDCDSFDANWDPVAEASSYEIDVAEDPGFTIPVAGFFGLNVGNVTTVNVTGLNQGTLYFYQIRAVNACGISTNSATIATSTLSGVPLVPTAIAATNEDCDTFEANWNSVPGVSSYEIDVAEDAGFTIPVTGFFGLDVGNVTTILVTGLNQNTAYFYRVRAINGCGATANSNTITTTTLNSAPVAPVANGPTNIGCDQFDANWGAVAEASSYEIDVAEDLGFTIPVAGFFGLNVGNVTTITVTGLVPNTSYFYRIRAVNGCGQSPNSNDVVAMTNSAAPTAPVAQVASSIGCVNFDANWNASTGASSYRIDVALDAGFTSILPLYNDLDVGNVTAFTVTGLANGTNHFYRVRAVNACGVSADSNVETATTLPSTDPLCGGGGTGTCATVVISPNPTPATCTNSDGSISFSIVPFVPAVNNTGVIIDIAGPVNRTNVNDSVFTNIPIGNYAYTIIYGDSSCTITGNVTVDQSGTVGMPIVSNIVGPLCAGDSTGSITLDVPGETGNLLQWSLDGINFNSFIAGNQITGIPAGPPPTFDRVISVRRDALDPCNASVTINIVDQFTQMTADITVITDATCGGNDGVVEISNLAGGDTSAPYQFEVDGVPTNIPGNNQIAGLSGGNHILTMIDGSGCREDIPFFVTGPGLIPFALTSTDPTCTNNGLDGNIQVQVDASLIPGNFEVGIATVPNAQDTFFTMPLTGFFEFTGLTQGTYYIAVRGADGCPNEQAVNINAGPIAITFDLERICFEGDQAILLTNITGEQNDPITIDIFQQGVAGPIETIPFPSIPFGNRVILRNLPFLSTPANYSIQITQTQAICPAPLVSDPVDFFITDVLSASVGNIEISLPDQPTGSIQIIDFIGGEPPYVIRAELDSSSVPGGTFMTEWDTVRIDPQSLQFEYLFENVPPGRYFIEVMDALGCIVELTPLVPLDESLFIPNIFTPNGDGVNETFFIRNLPAAGNEMVITNRWGRIVFETNDYTNDESWTGDGVSDGVYYYNLKLADGESFSGWVEIWRSPTD